jgi:hypothetical protein
LSANGFETSIAKRKSGQFDVLHEGELIYSKGRERRFPQPGEVLSLLQG